MFFSDAVLKNARQVVTHTHTLGGRDASIYGSEIRRAAQLRSPVLAVEAAEDVVAAHEERDAT